MNQKNTGAIAFGIAFLIVGLITFVSNDSLLSKKEASNKDIKAQSVFLIVNFFMNVMTNIAIVIFEHGSMLVIVSSVLICMACVLFVLYMNIFKRLKNDNEKQNELLEKTVIYKTFYYFLYGITLTVIIAFSSIVFFYNESSYCAVAKPIIYIYPEEEIELSVTLGNPDDITCSYPNYFENNGWLIKAFPNGDLVDLNSGRKIYSLYWEGKDSTFDTTFEKGFCVRGSDTATFLEEKLEQLGLNYKEAEEFIIYWLPKLEANQYNLIRFALTDECEQYMPLELKDTNGETIKPDSLIRILMMFKPLDYPIDVEEQELPTQSREGFTVIEWGGTMGLH